MDFKLANKGSNKSWLATLGLCANINRQSVIVAPTEAAIEKALDNGQRTTLNIIEFDYYCEWMAGASRSLQCLPCWSIHTQDIHLASKRQISPAAKQETINANTQTQTHRPCIEIYTLLQPADNNEPATRIIDHSSDELDSPTKWPLWVCVRVFVCESTKASKAAFWNHELRNGNPWLAKIAWNLSKMNRKMFAKTRQELVVVVVVELSAQTNASGKQKCKQNGQQLTSKQLHWHCLKWAKWS